MGQVSGNAGCVDDIVEGELVHEGGELQEQGQRLARRWRSAGARIKVLRLFSSGLGTHLSNTARGTSDNYF